MSTTEAIRKTCPQCMGWGVVKSGIQPCYVECNMCDGLGKVRVGDVAEEWEDDK